MKLLQINAWTLRLSVKLVEMMRTEEPDIVTLQEVLESNVPTGLLSSFKEFNERARFEHKYFSPVCSFRFMSGSIDFGNAIVGQISLDDTHTIFTNLVYKPDFSIETDDYNIRNFQHVTAKDEYGRPFHVINYHGYHIHEHKRGNDKTMKACRQLLDYAIRLDGPVIIAGDFNLEPGSESLGIFDEHFRNLLTEFGLSTTRNDLTHKTEVCDYIFVNDKITVNDFYVSKIVASDHQGLVLDFEIV